MMCGQTIWTTFLDILSRTLFAVHGGMLVWCVVSVKRDPFYWVLLLGVLFLVVEMIVTWKFTTHGWWKWFSPMVFLYLCTVIPSIWILELQTLQSYSSSNTTTEMYGKEKHVPVMLYNSGLILYAGLFNKGCIENQILRLHTRRLHSNNRQSCNSHLSPDLCSCSAEREECSGGSVTVFASSSRWSLVSLLNCILKHGFTDS